jgi:hypothetical protein
MLPLVLVVVLTSCLTPAAQRKLIDTVNEAQLAAAQTYDTAKVLQASAQTSCGAALREKTMPMPTPDTARATCAAIGVPLPYDPVKLQHAAGPVNALYDAVRYANTQRLAANGDAPAAVLGGLVGAFEAVIADLTGAGVAVPASVTNAVQTVKAATGGPQ